MQTIATKSAYDKRKCAHRKHQPSGPSPTSVLLPKTLDQLQFAGCEFHNRVVTRRRGLIFFETDNSAGCNLWNPDL